MSLVFAPALFDTLQAAAPPTIAFFKSLPTNTDERWAIYLLLLEKPGYRPKIYIGSGTNSLRGVSARFSEYNRAEALPQYVQKALDDGYTILYRGLLCWTAIPPAALQPKIRILFVAMEAAFSYVFWAMKGLKRDNGMSHICHWPRDTLEFDGLCSHCALAEPVSGDFDLTSEQLEAQAAELKQRRSALQAVVNTNYQQNQMLNNREGYKARNRKKSATYVEKRSDKAKASHNNSLAKAKDNKTYYCEICDLACGKKNDLARHEKSKSHIREAAAHHSSSQLD
jgi:hypothetical protein